MKLNHLIGIINASEHYKKLSTGKIVNICSYTIAECSWFIVSLNKDEYNEIVKKNEMNEDIDISSYTIECHDDLVEIRLGSWKSMIQKDILLMKKCLR